MLKSLTEGLNESQIAQLKREFEQTELLRKQLEKVLDSLYHRAAKEVITEDGIIPDWKNYRARKAGEAKAYLQFKKYLQ